MDILFNENEEVEEIATTIVIIKEKITDLEEIIERVNTLVNKLRRDSTCSSSISVLDLVDCID